MAGSSPSGRCAAVCASSGFYAWLKAPLSKRAQEDARQTELLKEAWVESGKVYGHRKLHDDLLEQGEDICLNRVARLTRLAGIAAQIGYKRRPGKYGGKPSVVVDHTLDRQFDVAAPDKVWDETLSAIGPRTMVERHHLHSDAGGLRLPGRRHRSVLTRRGRMVHAVAPDD